jgi:hypothetical protein
MALNLNPKATAEKAYAAGLNAGSGFLKSRLNAVTGGVGDIAKTAWEGGKVTLGTGETPGSPGAGGVIANTAGAVWNTISWGSERGLLNFSNTTLNPIGGKTWALNPLDKIRRLAAGGVETTSALVAGTGRIILPERAANVVDGIGKGVSRAAMGVVTGDFGHYLTPTPHSK